MSSDDQRWPVRAKNNLHPRNVRDVSRTGTIAVLVTFWAFWLLGALGLYLWVLAFSGRK